MMKKILGLLLSVSILSSVGCISFAEDNTVKTMTVDEAVAYAHEHSLEIAKCDEAIKSAEQQASQARTTKKTMQGYDSTDDTFLVSSGYAAKAAELSETVAKRTKEDTLKNVDLNVKKSFYTYLNSVNAEKSAESNYENATEKLTYAKAKLDSGLISSLDYKNFELLNMNAQNSLNSAKRSKELNYLSLKNDMNYTETQEFIPIGEVEYNTELVSVDVAISKSRETNTYLNISDTLALAKEKWNLIQTHYTSYQFTYSIEKATYNSAISTFKINTNALDMNIRNTYNTLLDLQGQIAYADANLDVLKTNSEAVFLRYQMGSATAMDYREAEQKYEEAQNSVQSLKLTYFVTQLSYNNIFTK